MMKIKFISEKQFLSSKNPRLFSEDEYSRSFGFIENENSQKINLAWRSSQIEPQLIHIRGAFYAVGIDNEFAIINMQYLHPVVKLKLQFNYSETTIIDQSKIILASEQEVYIIDNETFVIDDLLHLPDIYESISVNNNEILVKCLEGEYYKLITK